ncbi:MAG: SurA N-terminal domain-containing protein [Deltaproteobacteria bacterium]|nr:SurA N-terminal domain-containing protein [Deltaproteobacteria bacterium]
MLDQMRKQSQSAIVLLLFGFIIFVFVFSFGSGSVGFRSGGCGQANVAAIVNGETISEMEYTFHFDRQLQSLLRYRKGDSSRLKKEEKLQLRQQVMDFLVDQMLLIQAARALGLHVTDEERNEAIKEIKAFQDEQGHFDFKLYKMIVQRQLQTSPAMFEDTWAKQMLADRMRDIIRESARVTDEEVENTYRMQETKVDLEFVKLDPSRYKSEVEVTDADIQKLLADDFARVERFYNEREDRYHKARKVKVAHVFFEVGQGYDEEQTEDKRERAELTVEDLKQGAEFHEQAKDYSEDDGSKERGGELEMATREVLAARWGAPMAEAALALEKGKLSGVVKSDKGFHVIKCLEEIKAEDHSLEEVKAEIARELLLEDKAESKARSLAEQLLAGVKEGKTLQQLADSSPKPEGEGAEAEEEGKAPKPPFEVRSTGLVARMGGFIPQLGLDKKLARTAFELTAQKPYPDEVVETSSPLGGKVYIVMRLNARSEPDMDKLAEKRDNLRQNLLRSRQQRQIESWLQQARDSAEVQTRQALLMDTTPRALRGRAPVEE